MEARTIGTHENPGNQGLLPTPPLITTGSPMSTFLVTLLTYKIEARNTNSRTPHTHTKFRVFLHTIPGSVFTLAAAAAAAVVLLLIPGGSDAAAAAANSDHRTATFSISSAMPPNPTIPSSLLVLPETPGATTATAPQIQKPVMEYFHKPVVQPLVQDPDKPDERCDEFSETIPGTFEFHSPNYPDDYQDGLNCVKVISAGEGEVIRLRFVEHFHIESENDQCTYDYLEIRDGMFGYSAEIHKLCGTSPPTVVESRGRHLWLRFHSDQDIRYKGFKAMYEFVPSPNAWPDLDDCSFHLTNMEDWFGAENITEEILASRRESSVFSLDCTWFIEAPAKQKIYLQFSEFILEKANDCTYNFVEVYGEKTDLYSKDGRLKQFCGSETDSVFSTSNIIHVRMYTTLVLEKSDVGIGFKTKMKAYYNFFRDLQDSADPDGCRDIEEFDCTDNTCIAFGLTCNKETNCKAGQDEDKTMCKNRNKMAFVMTMDLIVIAFIGCFLAAGMCSGLILNICRKLRQDKIELDEIRQANLNKSRDSMASKSTKSKDDLKSVHIQDLNHTSSSLTVLPPQHTSKKSSLSGGGDNANKKKESSSSSSNNSGGATTQQQEQPEAAAATTSSSKQPDQASSSSSSNASPSTATPHHLDNTSSVDTVVYRPYYKDRGGQVVIHPPPPQQQAPPPPPHHPTPGYGFVVKGSPKHGVVNNDPPPPIPRSTSIPYSPPPPYNPAAHQQLVTAAASIYSLPPASSPALPSKATKTVQVEDEEVQVIEVRDTGCQTKESFTESYLRDVYFGRPKHYNNYHRVASSSATPTPSSSSSSYGTNTATPTPSHAPTPSTSGSSTTGLLFGGGSSSSTTGSIGSTKRAPLARGEAVELLDSTHPHPPPSTRKTVMRRVPKGPADVIMYPRSPGSIASSVDASTGSLELLHELDEEVDEAEKKLQQESKGKTGAPAESSEFM